MSYIILAINPGSTSTKIAVYEDTQPVLSLAIDHSAAEIAAFATIGDQFEWRKDLVLESLRKRGFDIGTLSAVIGRGGLVHPVEAGLRGERRTARRPAPRPAAARLESGRTDRTGDRSRGRVSRPISPIRS